MVLELAIVTDDVSECLMFCCSNVILQLQVDNRWLDGMSSSVQVRSGSSEPNSVVRSNSR